MSKELCSHDIYITASIEEAGANHVLEAMASGLPVVYHEAGGSIVDYCKDYGLSFASFEELLAGIGNIVNNYRDFKQKVLSYEEDNTSVVEGYIETIKDVLRSE